MTVNLKALIVVLSIAWVFFAFARSFCAKLISPKDYTRRRNVWFILTASGFLLPNFWLYILLATCVVYWASKEDSNPAALYMLVLYALPPVEFAIPQFIGMNHARLLSIVILVPVAIKALNDRYYSASNKLTLLDTLVIAFGLLQLVLFIPYEAFTNTIRRFCVYFLETFIIFFALARSGKSRAEMVEIITSFLLSCCVMSLLAGFESVRSWLLYQYISEAWGQENPMAYLLRDGKLRSQVSAGHSLALGYILAFGFGLSLYIRNRLENTRARILLPLIIWIGLAAAYSRAPWLTAIMIFISSFAIQPHGLKKAIKVVIIGVAIFGLVILTPVGDGIIAALPFVGTIDQENVTYRQQLAEVSWRLIQQNPWLGDPFFLDKMEELRQGQGIIDLMNGYASVALFSGSIGLALYLGVFILGMWRTLQMARAFSRMNDEFSHLGYCLVACMLGTLFFIGTAGTGSIYYVLAGMMASYVRIGGLEIAQVWASNSNPIDRSSMPAGSRDSRATT